MGMEFHAILISRWRVVVKLHDPSVSPSFPYIQATVKVKSKVSLVPVVESCVGSRNKGPVTLNLAPNRGKWSPLRSDYSTTREITLVYH